MMCRFFLFLIIVSFISCENIKHKEDVKGLEKKISVLEEKNQGLTKLQEELKDQIRFYKKIKVNSEPARILKTKEKVLKVLSSKFLIDTLETKDTGMEFIFKREVESIKLDKTFSIDDLGLIKEVKSSAGYNVFVVCDGDSLPLEMCNCTHSIYITIEPSELGEEFELIKIGMFYNVEIVSLENNGSPEWKTTLVFNHGKYPRKTKSINFLDFELKEVI